jgi:hypothetical protein
MDVLSTSENLKGTWSAKNESGRRSSKRNAQPGYLGPEGHGKGSVWTNAQWKDTLISMGRPRFLLVPLLPYLSFPHMQNENCVCGSFGHDKLCH